MDSTVALSSTNLNGDRSLFFTYIVFLLWHIWKQRCSCVFDHIPPDPNLVARKAYAAAIEFLQCPSLRHSRHVSQPLHSSSHWSPPSFGSLKFNTDATWHSDSLSCGVAVLIQDSFGKFVAGSCKSLHAISAVAAEALPILEGLSLAASVNINSFILESDSFHIISAISQEKFPMDWSVAPLIWQICSLASSFTDIS
jgi:hypothetical protein